MCTGLFIGFAGIQFSGSPSLQGDRKQKEKKINITGIFSISLMIKYSPKEIFPSLKCIFWGLILPFSCKKKMCKRIKTTKISGSK
jgi:hypothetical protein